MIEKKVKPGVEVFLSGDLSRLKRKSIAVLSNYSAADSSLVPTIELLNNRDELNITTLLAPEHGLWGKYQAGENVPSQTDKSTGLPVLSLYDQSDPTSADLPDNTDERMRSFDTIASGKKINTKAISDIDTIILDLQDIGVRIYTYISTMGYLMGSISGSNKELIILDRPNPITGSRMEGPVLEYPQYSSFVGFYSIPVRHGMTIGELASLFNKEIFSSNVRLKIIKTGNWERNMWFDQSGLNWINPSPNIPTLKTATVYPGMVFLEGTNISEGRGTTIPFEVFGAPWTDGKDISEELNRKELDGVLFRETYFKPTFSKYSGEDCSGVRIFVTDRDKYSPFNTMLHVMSVIRQLYPDHLELYKGYFDKIAGNSWLSEKLTQGIKVEKIESMYERELSDFAENREKYLLYD